MEVIHIHWSGKPIIGGIERHLDSLILELNRNGCSSRLICGNEDKPPYQFYFRGLGNESNFNVDDFYHLNKDIIEKSDIIHIHNGHVIYPDKTSLIFDFLKRKNKKVILSIHNIDICEKSKDIVNLPFDSYVTYSSFMQRTVKNIFGKASEVLPCYIKIDYTPEEEVIKTGSIRILQPTRFSRWKGSNLSLECIVSLLNEGYDIEFIHGGCWNLLYGGLKIPENARRWINEGKIKLKTYQFDEIGKEVKQADIILHPTIGVGEYGEPFSLVCLESMLLKKPIIASDSGFVPYLLEEYSRSQIVKAGNKKELLDAIRRWLTGQIPKLSQRDNIVIEKWKNYIGNGPLYHTKFYEKLFNGPGRNRTSSISV